MDPAAISTGMGEGMAQVFKPQEDFLGEAMKAAQAKKKESAANKAKALEMLNKEYHIWTERDGAEFAKKQKELWDGLSGRDLDTAETMLWLNQKQQELTYLADRSNQDRELYKSAANLYATKPTKYFGDTVNNLQEFASPTNALGASKSWNPLWMSERPDLDTDVASIATKAKAWADANKRGTARVGTLPGGGETKFKIEETTTEYPHDMAVNDVRVYMSEPNNLKAVQERYKADDPTGAKYKDVYDYAEKVIVPRIQMASKDVNAAQMSNAGFGGGAGGFTPGGWGVEETKTETPILSEQEIQSAIQSRLADSSAKSNYELLKRNKKVPKITEDGKQRSMTFEEYEEDLVRKSPTAQSKQAGAVYNFGRASKTGEATEIKYMEITSGDKKGIQFKPTQITIRKGKEPIFSGLDPNDNKIEIPYSELSGKLRVETGGDWDLLREKIAKEQGFDPFAPYEPKKPASGTATGGAKNETKKPSSKSDIL